MASVHDADLQETLFTPMKVLIIDNDLESRRTLQRLLLNICTECVRAGRAEKGLEVFEMAIEDEKPFDLITLDMELPDINGIELLDNLRFLEDENEIPEDKKSKILMVATQGNQKIIDQAFAAGCNEYLIKPIKKQKLHGLLQKIGIEIKKDDAACDSGHTT